MRVALPLPHDANPQTALGADFSSRRLIESLHKYAVNTEFEPLSCGRTGVGTRSVTDSGQHLSDSLSTVESSRCEWDLLHDLRPAGDPRRHFYLRGAMRARFPVVLTHHSLCYPIYIDSFFVPLLLARAQSCDAVVCTSRASRDAFVNLLEICGEGLARLNGGDLPKFEGQLPVIPNGVDADLFRPREVADVRHQLGIPGHCFVMLWVGRLSSGTKADLLPLLRAYWLLRHRNPGLDTLLVLVGTDAEGYGRVLETYATSLGLTSCMRIERVRPQSPVHLWYSAADVFVSPVDNVQETFGNAPIEAMAAGIPQVVSDWDGYRDTVVHGTSGFRVRTFWTDCDDDAVAQWAIWGDSQGSQALLAKVVASDVDELAGYLECLLRSPELRKTMGAASRTRALAEYAWPMIVGRYVQCWADLVERSRRRFDSTPLPLSILPAFFRAFAGYASRILTGETRVRICPDAETPPSRETSPGDLASDVEPFVTGLDRVLSTLREQGGELALDELSAELACHGYPQTELRRLVLRGVKYGFLDIA